MFEIKYLQELASESKHLHLVNNWEGGEGMLKMKLLEIFVLLFAVGSVISKFYLIETDEKTAKNNNRKVFCVLDY